MRENTFVKFLLHFLVFDAQKLVVIFENLDNGPADNFISRLNEYNDKDVFDSFECVIHVSQVIFRILLSTILIFIICIIESHCVDKCHSLTYVSEVANVESHILGTGKSSVTNLDIDWSVSHSLNKRAFSLLGLT